MKTIVIFCRSLSVTGHPFASENYWNSYLDLLLELKAQGAQVYFATHGSYLGGGLFEEVYTADAKVPLKEFHRETKVKADLVFDKGGFEGQDVAVINPAFVHKVASSKLETFKHFAKYQPKTVLCENRGEVERALAELSGDIVVVKEPHEYVDGVVSNGGKFVYIGDRKTVLEQLPSRYPLMAQEFVDSSIGIAELANGVHDMRVEIGGGTIWGGSLRTPAPGELRANLAQGGTRRRLSAEEIPLEVRHLALEIDTFFERYPRYYSLDFAHTTLGWKLFELNSNPGLVPAGQSPQAQQIMNQLAAYLIQVCPGRK